MTHQVTDREILEELAARPIGHRDLDVHKDSLGHISHPDAIEAAQRANKKWLPQGKAPATSPESRARQAALKAAQTDIEDAVEAAGGTRGKIERA